MHINLLKEIKKTRHLLPNNLGKVIDVGSLDVNGKVLDVIEGTEYESYLGIDMREGKNVDVVMNGHDLIQHFEQGSFDTVVCMNTMEHDDAFWLTLNGINHVIKPGGHFIFAVPHFYFPEHNYPDDYWRMSESATRNIIFRGYEILHIRKVFTAVSRMIRCEHCQQVQYNYIIFAVGRKL